MQCEGKVNRRERKKGDKKGNGRRKGKEEEKEMERKMKVLCSNFLPTKTFHVREAHRIYLIKLKKFLKLTRLTRPSLVLYKK